MCLPHLVRPMQICIILYVGVAVLYTTNQFVFPIFKPCFSRLGRLSSNFPYIWRQYGGHNHGSMQGDLSSYSPCDSSQFAFWNEGHDGIPFGPAVHEETFLSKAFSRSMRPSKIIPYFYRAGGRVDADDITITTLVTSNRFPVFAQLVENYKGPISVTIHVTNSTQHLRSTLASLHTLYTSSPLMSAFVDVHLVIDSFDRQFNTWRNLARLFARTEFVMMLDVDFALCTDFRTAVRRSAAAKEKLRSGSVAFVIPAFEYVKHSDGTNQSTFPRDKESLLSLIKARRIGMFHQSWAPGHNSTDYQRYYAASPGSVYEVTHYSSAYEPYVIFARDGPPWCDERFIGYGGNKAACLFEMYISGMSFLVLSDHFIIHQNHHYEETARRNERRYNRRLYSEFKQETCIRYIKSYYASGLLNTTEGQHLQEECKKVRGVSRIAAKIIDDAL